MTEGIHYSKDIEAAVLGICTLENTAFSRTNGLIDENVFYIKDNQQIYVCLKEMYENTISIDALTVWHYLINKGIQLQAGNPAWYLAELQRAVVNSAHLEDHCFLLKKMWRTRELERLTKSGIDVSGDVKQQAYKIHEQINRIVADETVKDWYSSDELMYKLFIHQSEIQAGKKTFIPTSFPSLDRENGGFTGGQLIVIGARPSVGKSALMGKMALCIADAGKVVGVVSLEMKNEEIAARLASLETDMEFSKIYRNLFNDQKQHEQFYNIISKSTIHKPFYVSDKTKVDITEIRAKAYKLKHQHGLDCLMIDYLQLVDSNSTNKNYNREQEVSKISRGLKSLAMELNIPVIALCQLNRQVANRNGKDRYPKPSDLRESGSLEQDADIIMMLHRDWVAGVLADENGQSTEYKADLLIPKWRNGAQCHLELDFEPTKMRFSERRQSVKQLKPEVLEEGTGPTLILHDSHEEDPF